jgi:putative hydrolase of the HAD superfamily
MDVATRQPFPRSIEALFLDAVGTLFEVRGSVGKIYSQFGLRHGWNLDDSETDQSFVQAFRAAPPLAFSSLEGTELREAERLWWKDILRKTLKGTLSESNFEQYFSEIFEFFRTADAWRVYPDTRPSLERLCRRGYRLALVSNSDSRLEDVLTALDLNSFFERITLSAKAGAAKPDPAIFHKILEAMRVPASRALHAGDSLDEDIDGALRAGLSAILIDRHDRYSGWTDGHRVRNLEELCVMLGS